MTTGDPRFAVFFAAAGVETGWGHAVRCGALSSALLDCGWRVAFVCRPEVERALEAVLPPPAEIVSDAPIKVGSIAAWARDLWPAGCDLLVLDDYALEDGFEPEFRPWARRSLVMEDIPNRRLAGDLLLDPTPGRTRTDYDSFLPRNCAVIGGARHALLRPAFSHVKRMPETPPRVLVAFGATDPSNATAAALVALEGLSLDIVLGSSAPHLDGVRRMASAHRPGARLHVDIDANALANLMGYCALAVGAGGSGAWERCAAGLPSVVLEVADNQRHVVQSLIEAGAAISGAEDVRAAVDGILTNRSIQEAMSCVAHNLCDGLGVMRVARMLSGIRVPKGGRVTLTPAAPADSDLMYDWQLHPGTRRFAKQPNIPAREEHDVWFLGRMANAESMLYMIEHEGQPSGVLRLDAEEVGVWLVSIYVAPDCHGRGIAGAALTLAHTIWPQHEFKAEVLKDNVVSHKLFARAGYKDTNGLYRYPPRDAMEIWTR